MSQVITRRGSPRRLHGRTGATVLLLLAAATTGAQSTAKPVEDNGSPLVSAISMDLCKEITDADLKAIAPRDKMDFLPSSKLTGASFDGTMTGLVGGKEADCRYYSGQTMMIVEIGDLPGDKYTKGTQLSKQAYQQVVQHWSPSPQNPGRYSISPLPGVGEEGTLSTFETGRAYIARQGSVVIVARLEKSTASSGQYGPMPALVKRVLARGAAIAATDVVAPPEQSAGEGPDGPVATGSAQGSLSTSGTLTTTWNYRPGGEIDCGGKAEVPLETSTHDAAGYLDVVIDGSAKLGVGNKGGVFAGTGGHVGDVVGPDTQHPTQHVSVDGVLKDTDGKQITVRGAFDLRCK
jgi:hypothetical protein